MDDEVAASSSNCILMMDDNGNPVGTYGDCDDLSEQWGNSVLNDEECSLLDIGNPLPGADTGTVNIEKIRVFPNPISANTPLYMNVIADEDLIVTIKLVIIDKAKNVLSEIRYLTPTNYSEEIIPSEFFDFYKGGEYYEIYYKIFTEGNGTAVFSGHGTILYCDVPNVANVETDCF